MLMAAAMLIPIVANLMAREPEAHAGAAPLGRSAMEIEHRRSLRRFLPPLRLAPALLTVLFILLFKIPEQATDRRHHESVLSGHGFHARPRSARSRRSTASGSASSAHFWAAPPSRAGACGGRCSARSWSCGMRNLLYLMLLAPPWRHDGFRPLVISAREFDARFLGPADRGLSFIAGQPRAHTRRNIPC